jgi:hypothetical protein
MRLVLALQGRAMIAQGKSALSGRSPGLSDQSKLEALQGRAKLSSLICGEIREPTESSDSEGFFRFQSTLE